MLLGARQFFERRGAPFPYDAEVEYIEGTGTQYINTGVHGENGMELECRFLSSGISEASDSDSFPFLARRGARRLAFVERLGGFWGFGAMTALATYENSADRRWHKVKIDTSAGEQFVALDGTIIKTWTVSATDPTSQPIHLFAGVNTMLPPTEIGAGRIETFSITNKSTGAKIRDMQSVRFTNELGQSEGAMYDRVSGQLFRNAGTGAFLYGPDKS